MILKWKRKLKQFKGCIIKTKKRLKRITETLIATKDELVVPNEQLTSLQTLQSKFEKNIAIKEREVVALQKSVDDTKNEFKSNT